MSADDHPPKQQSSCVPRAIIHKQILDAAAANPEASIDALADDVQGASPNLVEQVLAEYGDPASDEADPGTDGLEDGTGEVTDSTASSGGAAEHQSDPVEVTDDHDSDASTSPKDSDGPDVQSSTASAESATPDAVGHDAEIDLESLSPTQRETVLEVAATPGATQREIGDRLGVSAATVSQRVSAIPGFEWSDRERVVEALAESPVEQSVTDGGSSALADRGSSSDNQPAEGDGTDESETPRIDESTDSGHGTEWTDVSDDQRPDTADETTEDDDSKPAADDQATAATPQTDPRDGTASGERLDSPATGGVDEGNSTAIEADHLESIETTLAVNTETLTTLARSVAELTKRIDTHEAALSSQPSGSPLRDDPELAAKVVRACVRSEEFDEREELRVIESLLAAAA